MSGGQGRPARVEVPLLDLVAQYASIKDEILPAIEAVCAGQQLILGPEVRRLEERIAAYSGARFGVGVSSGTDALLVALMALGVGPGDEVITSPYSFFATAGVVARLGARPVFVDVEEDTWNLDPAALARFLDEACERRGDRLIDRATGGTVRALMPVHLFGQCADLDALGPLARRHGLAIVEDAAQAIGSEGPGGWRAGSVGEVGCLSFYPSKNLGAFGDAGMVVTSDPALAERLRLLRAHGAQPKYHHALVGGNFRLDELQAAVLGVKLGHLDGWTARRREHAATYDRLLAEAGLTGVVRPPVVRPGRHIFNQYVLRVPERDRLRAFLAGQGIGTEVYYPLPLHLQPCFASLGYQPGDCPRAERAAAETMAIPVHPELRPEQIAWVVEALRRFHADGGGQAA